MVQFQAILLTLVLLLGGCTHYKTSADSTDPGLKPRLLSTPLTEAKAIAFEVAKQAFPDEVAKISAEDNTVVIAREWFWRGDTKITVTIEPKTNDQVEINAESKASWHRGNPATFDVSQDEITHYFKTLDTVYADYTNKR